MGRNGLVGGIAAGVICAMVGAGFAAVPLYRIFCQATGYDGTPQVGAVMAPGGDGASIQVRFDANTSPGLPWRFAPDQTTLTVVLGEDHLASYFGQNDAARPVTGVATYNVTPEKAARFFHKTACFCFDEQTLQPGQSVHFPLSFWVDPAIRTDADTRDVQSVTLSYTFFRSLDDAARNGGVEKAGPHVGRRETVSTLNETSFPR